MPARYNPSLLMTIEQVDMLVDNLMAKYYVHHDDIFKSNLLCNLDQYVSGRWKYRQRNHVTRRMNRIRELIAKSTDLKKNTLRHVYIVSLMKSYYEKYHLGHVVASSEDEAQMSGMTIYGAGFVNENNEFKITSSKIAPGDWKCAQKLNLTLLSTMSKSIGELTASINTSERKREALAGLLQGYTQDLCME